jgi:hypothetical protein
MRDTTLPGSICIYFHQHHPNCHYINTAFSLFPGARTISHVGDGESNQPNGDTWGLRLQSATRRERLETDSRLLLDVRLCRHEQAGNDFYLLHARVYQQGHVTTMGIARHWLWTLLWTPLQALPPWLHVPPIKVAMPLLRS